MLTRRKFLLGLAGGAVAGASSVAYTWRLEPRWLKTTEVSIPVAEPLRGAPLRILHLSDLHAGRWAPMTYLSRAVQQGLALRPDLICVTGDFYTCGDRWDDGAYAAVLAPLAAAAPTFA